MEDRDTVARLVHGRDPGDIAVDDENGVGCFEQRVLPLLVPLARLVERIVVRKVHRTRNGFKNADSELLAKPHQLADGSRIAAEIRGHDKRTLCLGERGDNRCGGVGRKRRRRDRPPLRRIDRNRGSELFLQHFSRGHQIDRPFRVAVGDLQRAMHDLLHVPAGADLVVVFHVAADDAALIADVLEPVDELVAAAAKLSLLRKGRGAGKDEDRGAAFGGIVDSAAERLGAAFDVDEHGLRLAAHLREAVGAAQRHHLVRAGDQARNLPAGHLCLRDRLDQRRVIAAEIGEDVSDSGFRERFEKCRAGSVHEDLCPRRYSSSAVMRRSCVRSSAFAGPASWSSLCSWMAACFASNASFSSPLSVSASA